MSGFRLNLMLVVAVLAICAAPAAAFGAGNIASISKIEGHNWRHGDIEDMLKTIAFLKGKKWTSMLVKRVYFGNWLRDYSQAMDVGSLKNIQAETVRILVWILSFLSFGYATAEFEVTSDRLGVYRPEEHIDNPKDYADNQDARKYDSRLRGPVQDIELQVDPQTGMKNYIANETLGIATSSGYVKFSIIRSIHFGRLYTCGSRGRGQEADLCEALRCLGQALHCLEDFGAHTNYTELALREMGYGNVFAHTGRSTEVTIRGRRFFPLVTGTFGVVDFLHSVLGEATDHFAQTEVEQMDIALKTAESQSQSRSQDRSGGSSQLNSMTDMLAQIPGTKDLAREAASLQNQSQAEAQRSSTNANERFSAGNMIPGTNIDPLKTASQIYPILEFRDRLVKMLSATIEKIPGLEALVEKISDTLTLFILSLLAPYIRPIIDAVSKQLKTGSSGVIDASGRHQYEPWTDPHCSDPTHSLLSKDHFSNILNEPAGQVASAILQYVAPRIMYAWEHPEIPVQQILDDVVRVFHHPALRDSSCEIQQTMFHVVEHWARSRPDGGSNLNNLLSAESVKQGGNHTVPQSNQSHNHGGLPGMGNIFGSGSHSKVSGAPWEAIGRFRDGPEGLGPDGRASQFSDTSSMSTTNPSSLSTYSNQKSYEPPLTQPAIPGNQYQAGSYPASNTYGPGPQPGFDQQQYQQGFPNNMNMNPNPMPGPSYGAPWPGNQPGYPAQPPMGAPPYGYNGPPPPSGPGPYY